MKLLSLLLFVCATSLIYLFFLRYDTSRAITPQKKEELVYIYIYFFFGGKGAKKKKEESKSGGNVNHSVKQFHFFPLFVFSYISEHRYISLIFLGICFL